ncbi:FAD dependent oxidoreductase [Lophiotrema nucula]|uniref:FAD dependent oxidoreductase n=1 Tax=Lophiotrema nucula TaxID=690887 RepID=A0A6A5Z5A2_9PLEO|nr:FAD dependent oxidoreductase [Lophiotrema nucula]
MGSLPAPEAYDVVVIGGGFGGIYSLNHLRGLGFATHMFEAGTGLGGIWHWNCYPGARVDTETPVYQLYAPELYDTWRWKERYSGRDEMVDYFNHIADLWDLKKDITFSARVTKAHWNQAECRWDLTVSTSTTSGTKESIIHCKAVVFCTGFASKHYTPPFAGMDQFNGVMSHTALWSEDIELKDKRVAVIGTGASGVQVVQEVAPIAKQLTLFQRTPNMALPMGQSLRDDEWDKVSKTQYPEQVEKMKTTYAGFLYDFDPRKTFEVSEEERVALFEELFHKGGVYFWLGTFSDVLKNKKANDLAYDFWRQKTLARINDPVIAEKLAPKVAPHAFGTKRISLEQDYFEQFNRETVDIVDLNDDPVETFTSKGIKTKTGEHEFDVIVLATGFDSVTGGLTQIDIRGVDGTTVQDKWAKGVWTHLGMTTAGFPNMFFVYGPQAPTAFATGPQCAETQGKWIGETLSYMREHGYNSIQPTPEAEAAWKEHVNITAEEGLFKETKSWYFGDNIPGKARESLNYMAGLPQYRKKCAEAAEHGYKNQFILA